MTQAGHDIMKGRRCQFIDSAALSEIMCASSSSPEGKLMLDIGYILDSHTTYFDDTSIKLYEITCINSVNIAILISIAYYPKFMKEP